MSHSSPLFVAVGGVPVFVNAMVRRVRETVSASVSLICCTTTWRKADQTAVFGTFMGGTNRRDSELSTWARVCSSFGHRKDMLCYVSPQFTNHQWINENEKKKLVCSSSTALEHVRSCVSYTRGIRLPAETLFPEIDTTCSFARAIYISSSSDE